MKRLLGYTLYNPYCMLCHPAICSEDAIVYEDKKQALVELKSLVKESGNTEIKIVAIYEILFKFFFLIYLKL